MKTAKGGTHNTPGWKSEPIAPLFAPPPINNDRSPIKDFSCFFPNYRSLLSVCNENCQARDTQYPGWKSEPIDFYSPMTCNCSAPFENFMGEVNVSIV